MLRVNTARNVFMVINAPKGQHALIGINVLSRLVCYLFMNRFLKLTTMIKLICTLELIPCISLILGGSITQRSYVSLLTFGFQSPFQSRSSAHIVRSVNARGLT